MKLFVGLDIPETIRAKMGDYIDLLAANGASPKWTNSAGWHITLKFIGWTKRTFEICGALKTVAAPPFDISFSGVGFFTPQQPRTFFAQVHAPEALPQLARQIDQALLAFNMPEEKRSYSPHLTLARTGSGDPHPNKRDRQRPDMAFLTRLVESVPEFQQPDFGTMTANEFVLYLSELSPKGATYTKLERYPLRA